MGVIYSIPPKDFHRGLYVTYYNDWQDCYMSTAFNLVLDEPTAPIDAAVMQTCARLFTFLLTGDLNREIITYGGNTVQNLMSFSYFHHFGKEDALAHTVKLCERFLNKDSIDPAVLADLPQYDKATEVVRTFLTDITENGKYEYEEDRT